MKTNHKVVSRYCDTLQLVHKFPGIMKYKVNMQSNEATINAFPNFRCVDKWFFLKAGRN